MIAGLDNAIPQEVPTSHLYYLPIVLAAWAFGYVGGTALAAMSPVLFALATYLFGTPTAPGLFLPAAALTFAYYLAVALASAAFFSRQR